MRSVLNPSLSQWLYQAGDELLCKLCQAEVWEVMLRERTLPTIPHAHGLVGLMLDLPILNLQSPTIRVVSPLWSHSPCTTSRLWSTLPLAPSHLFPTMKPHWKLLWSSRNPIKWVWCCLVFPMQSLCSCWWPQWEFLPRKGLEPILTPPEI